MGNRFEWNLLWFRIPVIFYNSFIGRVWTSNFFPFPGIPAIIPIQIRKYSFYLTKYRFKKILKKQIMAVIYDHRANCHSSACRLWVEHALAGAGLVREVLWGLACPVHCGGSSIPYLLLGLLCGFVLGIVLTLVTLWTFVNIQRHPVLPQHSAQRWSGRPGWIIGQDSWTRSVCGIGFWLTTSSPRCQAKNSQPSVPFRGSTDWRTAIPLCQRSALGLQQGPLPASQKRLLGVPTLPT